MIVPIPVTGVGNQVSSTLCRMVTNGISFILGELVLDLKTTTTIRATSFVILKYNDVILFLLLQKKNGADRDCLLNYKILFILSCSMCSCFQFSVSCKFVLAKDSDNNLCKSDIVFLKNDEMLL